jgi:hypothetical protein
MNLILRSERLTQGCNMPQQSSLTTFNLRKYQQFVKKNHNIYEKSAIDQNHKERLMRIL